MGRPGVSEHRVLSSFTIRLPQFKYYILCLCLGLSLANKKKCLAHKKKSQTWTHPKWHQTKTEATQLSNCPVHFLNHWTNASIYPGNPLFSPKFDSTCTLRTDVHPYRANFEKFYSTLNWAYVGDLLGIHFHIYRGFSTRSSAPTMSSRKAGAAIAGTGQRMR